MSQKSVNNEQFINYKFFKYEIIIEK
jgi:hypothetical protein